ncbi:MAG: dihydrodipicolinate synthase family protein [Haloarculaceae archaeon]
MTDDLRKSLRDVAFTLPTPFTADGTEVDTDGLASNVGALGDAGASLFVPCGNTGEYYSLTDDERVAVTATTVDAAPADATVVAGAGGSTTEVVSLADRYAEAGADAVMVMTPSHTYLHERGIVEYYRAIADRVDLPVVLYKRSHVVGDDLLAEVTPHPNVVAVKYAVNDVSAFAAAADDDDVVWINGIAERFAPSYALEGATGLTTGIGNALPAVTLALADALEAGEWSRAKRLRDVLTPLEDLRAEAGSGNDIAAANNVPVVKYCMELAGLTGGPVREPLVELDERDRQRAEEYYERAAGYP